MDPLVSVIMAAYNAEKTIGPAIRSILDQTYQNLELIIVDDASRDRTAEVVKSFSDSRIRLLRNKENLKLGLSLNIAIEAAKGKLIARQDADDLSLPNRLEKQVKYLLSHPEVDVVGSNAYLFDSSGAILGGLMKNGKTHQELTARISREVPFIHPTIMARAEWLKKYQYRNYPRSQDRDLWLRSYRFSNFAHLPEFLYAYRNPGKISFKKLVMASGTNLIMRLRHWKEYGLPVSSVLAYPPMLAGRWLYWGILALLGKSIFDLPRQNISRDARFYRDQAWILYFLDNRFTM